MDGVGKIVFPDGSYFMGEFSKSLKDGYGIEVSRGAFTAGLWLSGKYQPEKVMLGLDEFNKAKGTKGIDLGKNTPCGPASKKTLNVVAAKRAEAR